MNSFRLIYLALLVVFLAGCTVFGPPETESCEGTGFLFEDDFGGDPVCGWAEYENPGGSAQIQDGYLQITSRERGQFWWTNPGKSFSDTVISVQARQISGPDDNAFGVICRYQSPENFYMFLVSGDGYYAIGKFQTGFETIQYLTGEGTFVYSDVINQGTGVNEIRASCVSNELSLTVNGILLTTVTDPTFVTGDLGVGVTTFQDGNSIIQFDRMRVSAP